MLGHDKCITTPEFNNFSGTLFDEKIRSTNLSTKTHIADLITKTSFNDKLRKN